MSEVPVLHVEADTIAEAWEKAVLEVWEQGCTVKTEYDKPQDPPSKDATMVIHVRRPAQEPRIHRAFPGGLEDLEVYRQEVVLGIHDSWINPAQGKWSYTYHQRLANYPLADTTVDQLSYIVDKLSEAPHSRRAQAITWSVRDDMVSAEPPCLQRIWCRITADTDAKKYYLNMNTHWRSRDAYKAAFMNIFAFTDLQENLARKIAEKSGTLVEAGRYVDISDSFHVYGSYFKEFNNFLKIVRERSFKDRTWTTQFAQPFFEEARHKLLKESNV